MVFQGLMESNQYLPLTACSPSLSLISLQDLAGNSGIEPRGTGEDKQTVSLRATSETYGRSVGRYKRRGESFQERVREPLRWYRFSLNLTIRTD